MRSPDEPGLDVSPSFLGYPHDARGDFSLSFECRGSESLAAASASPPCWNFHHFSVSACPRCRGRDGMGVWRGKKEYTLPEVPT